MSGSNHFSGSLSFSSLQGLSGREIRLHSFLQLYVLSSFRVPSLLLPEANSVVLAGVGVAVKVGETIILAKA